ncbi:hypothetical protein J8K87_05450 [Bacteroides fragilis]|uniref:hypothetical protein n=1 Tax=Bacteroides fragilis TaxID=817 RepID=UPI00202E3531|nr:hypothetical protein [Bacteroides fragilis]MCM0383660.1 hypothetical protein [Bacteroides fragilis]
MQKLYIFLTILLSLSFSCFAQDGDRIDTRTSLGAIINLDDVERGYIAVEIKLEAHFHNNKLTNIILVAYKYKDGEIWDEAKPLFNGKSWITINKRVYPIKKLYEDMKSNNDISNKTKQTFNKLQDYFKLILPCNNSNIILAI